MLAKLYNQLPEYHRTDVLEAAIQGHINTCVCVVYH